MPTNATSDVTREDTTKHTPGPWTYEPAIRWDGDEMLPGRGFIVRTGTPGHHSDEIRVGSAGGPDEVRAEDRANAALIAAAPDLLAAARTIVEMEHIGRIGTRDTDTLVAYDALRAAVAKAEGRTA